MSVTGNELNVSSFWWLENLGIKGMKISTLLLWIKYRITTLNLLCIKHFSGIVIQTGGGFSQGIYHEIR